VSREKAKTPLLAELRKNKAIKDMSHSLPPHHITQLLITNGFENQVIWQSAVVFLGAGWAAARDGRGVESIKGGV
jgi:hypothetical protein